MSSFKNQRAILDKLGIESLNPMQEEAMLAIHSATDIVLLSPTGTGKTLAFLLPIVAQMDRDLLAVQCLILVPSRELAIQIEQVTRKMGAGLKVNAAYGGRPISKDKSELKHPPAILIGTPGRIADHLRRGTVDPRQISVLVLDEFDKSLEVGFEEEMQEIIDTLSGLKKRILTSATQGVEIPPFVGVENPLEINYLEQANSKLDVKLVISPTKDKLPTLLDLICHLGEQPGIVFCNFKDSIQRVSDYLTDNGIRHGCFYGSMEQKDRELALVKFRNGTHQLIVSTDLAARGIDVQEIKFIIHYHLPQRAEEFIHRNGRTARMHSEGTAYVLKWEDESLPDFISSKSIESVQAAPPPAATQWTTLFISGGRRDKISKGDIAGLCCKVGGLESNEVGMIELKPDCAYVAVAVDKSKSKLLLHRINNYKLKKKKVRVYEV